MAGAAVAALVGVAVTRNNKSAGSASSDDLDEGHEDWDDPHIDESLSVWDAADIWRSSGEDEDYMFGYDWEQLANAADE